MIRDALTLERLLTSPAAFGLATATPVQRAICRALDGIPLAELADDEDVRAAFGDVAALPTFTRPREVHILAAIRSAKSLIAAASIVRASQVVDLSNLGDGDVVRISVVSIRLDNTRAVLSHLLGNLQAKPLLRGLLLNPDEATETYLELRHPSGRPIEVVPVPLDRAGGSITSFWSAGIVADEEPRMLGAEDGTKNWDHARDAGMGRLLPNAQWLGIGSPWAPMGPIYDLVQEHFGKPSADLVIARATGPVMNPVWWTPKRCAALQRSSPTAYRTDVLCEFSDPETSLLSSDEVKAATRESPAELTRVHGARYVAAIDPATRGNSFGLAIVQVAPAVAAPARPRPRPPVSSAGDDEGGGGAWISRSRRPAPIVDETPPERAAHRVALVHQWTGAKGAPLSVEKTLAEVGTLLRRFGLTEAFTDQWSADPLKELAKRVAGITLTERVTTAASKFEMLDGMRLLIASEGVELPPDPVLRRDLISLRRRVTQAGVQIVAGRSADGRHADMASCLALALAEAQAVDTSTSLAACLAVNLRAQPLRYASAPGAFGGNRGFG
jgi:hypothetical protein